MKTSFSPSKFWPKFSKHYWEKKPLALKKKDSPLFEINAEDIFNFLVRYSDYCRSHQTTEGLKFYVDGQLQYENELLEALPVQKDKSLAGYHNRMKKTYEDYCLVCDELSQGSGEKWPVIQNFLTPLYQEIGIPNKYAEMGLYLGNYRKTPFGVHVDGCGVFSFPVVGTKRFRLWKPEFVEKNPDLKESFSYESYKKHSELLEVEPGEMAYWPSHAWHIAESDGSFTATWSIGLWLDEPFSQTVLKTIHTLLSKKQSANKKTIQPGKKNGKEELPEQYLESTQLLKKISVSDWEDAFMRSWLISKSKLGFKSTLLPRVSTKLSRTGHLQGNLLWAELHTGVICIAVNGFLVELKKNKKLLSLIEKVCSGNKFSIDKLGPHEFKLVEILYSNYAVSLV